jgi:hypothetical protein
MITRFRWVFLALLAGGVALWLGLAGDGPKAKVEDRVSNEVRQSSRHRAGEVEKHLATPLEKQVVQLEQQLVDRQKALAELAKSRSPVYLGAEGAPPSAATPEDAEKKVQAARNFEDAKREFLADRQLLQKLKQELVEEQAKAKSGADSR